MKDYLIVIPARYNSSRFPGKPLVDILGKSMVKRVWEKCIKALNPDNVIIATDDKRISDHCMQENMNVIMTSKECLTGTDRIFEVSEKIKSKFYINVQGDEPLISSEDIIKVINASKNDPNAIINGMCLIYTEEDFNNPNIPKVVVDTNKNLLFMSRAAIPTNKKKLFVSAYKQVCIYAFPALSLKKYGSAKSKTPIEKIEDIEILRFLELGLKVKMIEVSDSSIAVDIPEDLDKVIASLNE